MLTNPYLYTCVYIVTHPRLCEWGLPLSYWPDAPILSSLNTGYHILWIMLFTYMLCIYHMYIVYAYYILSTPTDKISSGETDTGLYAVEQRRPQVAPPVQRWSYGV